MMQGDTSAHSPIRVERSTETIWRVFLDDPPLNLLGPEMIAELHRLVVRLEGDEHVKVVIFESAVPEFFMAHVDLLKVGQGNDGVGPTGMAPWPDLLRRMEQAPFITIGVLRGRARGVGSEFLQALDMRFASRELARIAQIEVGCGIIPGGGGLDRLPRMLGRGRAIEAICGADDFDAPTAELYGWINRALPDAVLDDFVNGLASRISTFDRKALAACKQIINERVGLASQRELENTYAKFLETLSWPSTQARLATLMSRGLQRDIDFERDLASLIIVT